MFLKAFKPVYRQQYLTGVNYISQIHTFKTYFFNCSNTYTGTTVVKNQILWPHLIPTNRTNAGHVLFCEPYFFLFFDSCLPLRPQKN